MYIYVYFYICIVCTLSRHWQHEHAVSFLHALSQNNPIFLKNACLLCFAGLEFKCGIGEDLERIHEARQLSSLKELRLSPQRILYTEEVSRNAHGVLALAVAMSAKTGPPMSIIVSSKRAGASQQRQIEEEINQLQKQWASISKTLKSVHRQNCDVLLNFLST